MAKGYPHFEVKEVDENTNEIAMNGKTYRIDFEYVAGGSYKFVIDKRIHQTCNGHPVLEDQAPGVPPAAVIAVITGGKTVNLPWSTYWESYNSTI